MSATDLALAFLLVALAACLGVVVAWALLGRGGRGWWP